MADQTATGVTRNEVITAITTCNATGGGTVTIPPGTATWIVTGGDLTITQDMTIVGAGIGNTIIIDGLPVGAPSPQKILSFITSVGKRFRISGIEFQGSASRIGPPIVKYTQGTLYIAGASNQVRVDHCHWGTTLLNRYLFIGGSVLGVCDHCSCNNEDSSQGIFYIDHSNLFVTNSFGDGSWSNPTNFGSSTAFFFEDNVFTNVPTTFVPALTDGNGGDRIVVRYNVITRLNVQGHGTGSTGRTRSIRSVEMYENQFILTTGGAQAAYIRGGTGVIWNNTCTGGSPVSCFTMADFRQLEYIYTTWGGENGLYAWDNNDVSNQSGNGYNGDINGLYASGTAQAGSTGRTLVISGSGAISNWTGYAVINLDQFQPGASWTGTTTINSPIVTIPNLTMSSFYLNLPVAGDPTVIPPNAFVGQIDQAGPPAIFRMSSSNSSYIPYNALRTTTTATITLTYTSSFASVISNVGNTLTVTIAAHPANQQTWTPGNHYEIRKVLQALDAIGVGPGDYIGGGFSPIPRNLNQVSEPLYLWNNKNNGLLQGASSNGPNTIEGRDFINNGITPKPGYTPFPYPHPLQGGSLGKIIFISGDMSFGNVIIGESLQKTFRITNQGDVTLTVNGISYPSKFTGITTTFTVAAGAFVDVTVTYIPTTETVDGGTITVDSNADSGVETIVCSGTGVPPVGGGGEGHGRGHKKGVLSRRM